MKYLKEKLFNKFFKYESYIVRNSEKEISDLVDINRKLNENLNEYLRLEKRLLETFNKHDMVLGIEENNKNDKYIIACNSYDNGVDIYLIHSDYHKKPFIQSILHTNYSTWDTSLEITNVQSIDNSVGNGNILMNNFLKEAKRKKVKYIYGKLAFNDRDNFYRSIPFYRKFGFDINMNDEGTEGGIKLYL